MLKGFKDFALKGNLIEVAVGLVMALAIFALVQALIESLITPLIGAIVGEPDFGGLTFTINGSEFFYGNFINALITFLSVAAAVYFFMVVPYERTSSIEASRPTCAHAPSARRDLGRRDAMPELHGTGAGGACLRPSVQPSPLLPQSRGFKGIGFAHHTFDSTILLPRKVNRMKNRCHPRSRLSCRCCEAPRGSRPCHPRGGDRSPRGWPVPTARGNHSCTC